MENVRTDADSRVGVEDIKCFLCFLRRVISFSDVDELESAERGLYPCLRCQLWYGLGKCMAINAWVRLYRDLLFAFGEFQSSVAESE
jgi:hypothetical protein